MACIIVEIPCCWQAPGGRRDCRAGSGSTRHNTVQELQFCLPRIILSLLTHFADVMLTGIVLNIGVVAREARATHSLGLYIYVSIIHSGPGRLEVAEGACPLGQQLNTALA